MFNISAEEARRTLSRHLGSQWDSNRDIRIRDMEAKEQINQHNASLARSLDSRVILAHLQTLLGLKSRIRLDRFNGKLRQAYDTEALWLLKRGVTPPKFSWGKENGPN